MIDLRKTLAAFDALGALVRVDHEIALEYEIAGVLKSIDDGPVPLFTNIAGYSGHRVTGNLFSRRDRLAAIYGCQTEYMAPFLLEKIRNPLQPVEVSEAPSQTHVIMERVDIPNTVPVPKQTERDAGRIITGGMVLVQVPGTQGFNLSYHRMNVVGPSVCSLAIQSGRHLMMAARRFGTPRIPVTVNIGAGLATLLAGSASPGRAGSTPFGFDELGLAGALQGEPVGVVRARSVPGAWSLAEAEWVLEGYLDTSEYVYEEASGREGEKYFMAEAAGYMGRAWRTWKFEATAITFRRDPIYFFPLADSLECVNLMGIPAEVSVYEACRRIDPQVFDTCYVLPGMRGVLGVVIRVQKGRRTDEGVQNNLLLGALSAHSDLCWAIAVDHDVDVTDANDVLWAMVTRMQPDRGMFMTPPARTSSMVGDPTYGPGVGVKLGVDATFPMRNALNFSRPRFPEVDLSRWFSPQAIGAIRSQQSEYARSLATRRM